MGGVRAEEKGRKSRMEKMQNESVVIVMLSLPDMVRQSSGELWKGQTYEEDEKRV
jgi:hypothetical protein